MPVNTVRTPAIFARCSVRSSAIRVHSRVRGSRFCPHLSETGLELIRGDVGHRGPGPSWIALAMTSAWSRTPPPPAASCWASAHDRDTVVVNYSVPSWRPSSRRHRGRRNQGLATACSAASPTALTPRRLQMPSAPRTEVPTPRSQLLPHRVPRSASRGSRRSHRPRTNAPGPIATRSAFGMPSPARRYIQLHWKLRGMRGGRDVVDGRDFL